ncbi:ABC-F family ATP-binding cassette domain-containing protein [Methylorubrum populi]|jgi:ATPase subunit of ABC transporter with duplicated ATPase domains|uniref:ABC-F family ATP-binding cassette domain-containing protein n=1 Tax=Methylobacteriaceae TaxID=119045 RepID=UPI000DB526EC|nr:MULTISPECIES: ABC-F family ATP-binding cassette domain-containing protein [Methylobacteriaceae]MBX9930654.1 ATP-binding cassette domain-containing protein [Methylobacterium sp.]MDV2986837.1 ABC-F family ATP-binding cassette domain-containing protein [Methylobacteriaceae bacterium AG10]PZP67919.1 MAG: ABC transporter [Methylorubrum populi]
MSVFLTLNSVSARTPDRPLFSDLTFAVGTERVGLVGRNGSGKSTLLRIVAGSAEPSSGTVRRTGTIGVLWQDMPGGWTLAEALGVTDGLEMLERILAGNGTTGDFDAADWTLESRIGTALVQAGLPDLPLDRHLQTLSGGERTRVGIARLVIEAPDLLLLDEPTNNLDADGRAAIRALVRDWRGGVLVASHDRELLENVDRILELTTIEARSFGGGWSAFAAVRDEDRRRARAELERADADVRAARQAAQAQREAKERRDRAGRAFAAKGSEPKILLDARAERAENSGGRAQAISDRRMGAALAEVEEARSRVEVLTPLTIDLPPSGLPSGANVLAMEGAIAAAGDRRLGPWTLRIDGPERIALKGANGAGKTTLLRIAAGLLAPVAGTVRRAEGRIVMLDQHVGLLDPEGGILDNIRRLHPDASDEEAYALCARFAFRNRDAQRIVGTLSGGERLRAGLAAALAGSAPPWLIILDEPTNHLDIESVEVLESALRSFDGALLVVSHDPSFVERVGVDRVFEV